MVLGPGRVYCFSRYLLFLFLERERKEREDKRRLKPLPFVSIFPFEKKGKDRTQGSNLRDSVANNPGSWNPWTYSPDRQVPTSGFLWQHTSHEVLLNCVLFFSFYFSNERKEGHKVKKVMSWLCLPFSSFSF